MIDVALMSLRPGAQWVLDGDTLEGLVWLDESSRPSDTEIIDEINRLKPIIEYRAARSVAYPSIVEQLDLMFHDFDSWRAAIQAVKDTYPKPT